jgi:hypothetical protein
MFGGFIEIAHVSISDTKNLTIFKEIFFDIIREIMGEHNDFLDITS